MNRPRNPLHLLKWYTPAPSYLYLWLVVLIPFKTGLRKGNVLGLQWSNVDLSENVIRVDGANMKADRDLFIPINSEFVGVLRSRYDEVEPEEDDFVIGREIHDIKKSWAGALRGTRIKGRKFHDTRTSVGTWLAEAGVPLQVAIHLLWHSPKSLGVHGRYVRPSMPALCEAVERLSRLLD